MVGNNSGSTVCRESLRTVASVGTLRASMVSCAGWSFMVIAFSNTRSWIARSRGAWVVDLSCRVSGRTITLRTRPSLSFVAWVIVPVEQSRRRRFFSFIRSMSPTSAFFKFRPFFGSVANLVHVMFPILGELVCYRFNAFPAICSVCCQICGGMYCGTTIFLVALIISLGY